MSSDQTRIGALTAAWIMLGLSGMLQIATAASPSDACALLSRPQLATALGVDVDAGRHIIGAGDCRWTQTGKAAGADVVILQVNLTTARAFEIAKTPMSGWNKTHETGIGDDAYTVENGKVTFLVSPTLSVRRGSVFFAIFAKIPKASVEQTKALEKTVALMVLEKL